MIDRDTRRTLLKVDSLEIGFGRQSLLPPLNASLSEGELVAVIGRNGIGKSTLLRTLAGLQPSLGGKVSYFEEDLASLLPADMARIAGYLSTDILKASQMTVYELVSLGRYPYTNWLGINQETDRKAIVSALSETGLSAYPEKYVSEISDGERQKAMIARILAQDTPVMIMDEPTAFIDVSGKYEILHLLHSLSRKAKKTILFSTHDLHMALTQCDKMWVIANDRLHEGAPEDLILSGILENLFESEHVKFDSETADFIFHGDKSGSFSVEGSGSLRLWTEKALVRSGFSVSHKKTNPYIETDPANGQRWKIVTTDSYILCNSIYELIIRLQQNQADYKSDLL